jgi:CRP-like cAMP-binding protein
MKNSRVKLLQDMPVFGGIDQEALEYLVSLADPVHFTKGDFLFREGDPGNSMLVLEEGTVAVIKHWRGKEYLLGSFLGAGVCVGEMSLIDLEPRSASVVAMDSCKTLCIEAAHLNLLHKRDLAQFTMVHLNIARELCRRLRVTGQQLFEVRLEADLVDGEFSFHRQVP